MEESRRHFLPQYMISIKSSIDPEYISSNSLVELENIQIENNKDGIQVGKIQVLN